MKIGVLIKQVPARDSELKINADESWIDETGLEFESSEPDDYALEAGLQIKEAQGGEVVVLSLGPDRVTDTIRTALAKGADRGVHIVDEHDHGLDPLQVAGALANVAEAESFDLVLSGLQSDDYGYGQTGVLLAELLGVPHATVVVDIEAAADKVTAKRELEEGWFQSVELPLPGVLTIQSGINKPRYTSFKGIMAARKKEIRAVPSQEVMPADLSSGMEILRVYAPEVTGTAEMLEGSAGEQAAALVEKLKYQARVL
jgi:electron transfer flavoprotein beta subunit